MSTKAFICVFRQIRPKESDWKKVQSASLKDSLLKKYLNEYQGGASYYDWGDDPSFFSAKETEGNFSMAGWGVCRRDVRTQLSRGDLVIYFCARQSWKNLNEWNYYFVGFGTVRETIDRRLIWSDPRYATYRSHLNLLTRPKGKDIVHHEPLGIDHKDWEKRAKARHILFDVSDKLTDFNLVNPLHVANYKSNNLPSAERWLSKSNSLVSQLEQCLFYDSSIKRRLRSTHPQIPHRHIALHSHIAYNDRENRIANIRANLKKIAAAARYISGKMPVRRK